MVRMDSSSPDSAPQLWLSVTPISVIAAQGKSERAIPVLQTSVFSSPPPTNTPPPHPLKRIFKLAALNPDIPPRLTAGSIVLKQIQICRSRKRSCEFLPVHRESQTLHPRSDSCCLVLRNLCSPNVSPDFPLRELRTAGPTPATTNRRTVPATWHHLRSGWTRTRDVHFGGLGIRGPVRNP